MVNFNTYQTRNFYVAKAIDANVDTVGDIALGTTATGEAFFKYMNADGLVTRTDLIYPKNLVSVKKTTAAELATPLVAHKITGDTNAVTLSNLVGKAVNLNITLHQVISYDESDTLTIAASVVGTSTNTASAAAFYKALAKAIMLATPKFPEAPFKLYMVKSGTATEITKATADGSYPSDATSVVIVPCAQRWARGKMSNEPYTVSVAFSVKGSNVDDVVWGEDTVTTVAAFNTASSTSIPATISGAYALADLEYFALGERGDIYRGSMWPNEYDTKYQIDVTKNYNVLSIEYFWQGSAENVQKSPRMIQVVAEAAQSNDVVTTLYNSVVALTSDGKLASLDSRVETLEG